jgi:hypothetical protein
MKNDCLRGRPGYGPRWARVVCLRARSRTDRPDPDDCRKYCSQERTGFARATDSENRDDSRSVPHVAPPARFGVRLNFSFSSLIYRSMEAFSLGMRLTPSHAINKGQRYRYYVSAALITEAGTDRAQSRRMVARVLGTRPEWLSNPVTAQKSLMRSRIGRSCGQPGRRRAWASRGIQRGRLYTGMLMRSGRPPCAPLLNRP